MPAAAPSRKPSQPGPTLVRTKPSRPRPSSLLTLWHLLSLDAPTVAALWVVFIARCSGVSLPWVSPAAMFLAVWMLYAVDRLLDAASPTSELEERHRFHHRHKRAFVAGIILASIVLAWLISKLDPAALRLDALLASLLFAYFFLIHIFPTSRRGKDASHRLPKELAVGLFFPAAVFIPTIARAPLLRLGLAPNALLFAAVCILNCLFVYAWEHPGSRASAHWTTRFATRHLTAISALTMLIALGATLVQARALPVHQYFLEIACGLSTMIFLVLHNKRQHIRPIILRAAADLALLTPLLLVWRA